jgi:metal-sulfur cluster biosynthetic enzyme
MITEEAVRKVLRQVKDPELNLSIVDLGLVYDVAVDEEGDVDIKMSLTSPGCPSGPEIVGDAQRVVQALDGVKNVDVEIVWEPFWTPERIDPRVPCGGFASAALIRSSPSASRCQRLNSTTSPFPSAGNPAALRASVCSAALEPRTPGSMPSSVARSFRIFLSRSNRSSVSWSGRDR